MHYSKYVIKHISEAKGPISLKYATDTAVSVHRLTQKSWPMWGGRWKWPATHPSPDLRCHQFCAFFPSLKCNNFGSNKAIVIQLTVMWSVTYYLSCKPISKLYIDVPTVESCWSSNSDRRIQTLWIWFSREWNLLGEPRGVLMKI